MKITIVAGARPNFMKIAPITRAIEAARALGKKYLVPIGIYRQERGYKFGRFSLFGPRHESSRCLSGSGK